MKNAPWVLTLGLLLVIVAVCSAEMPSDKAAFYQAVDEAKLVLENGGQLTVDQETLLKSVGVIANRNGELDRAGGPDDYGFLYIDSNEPNGPEFNWIDISETGTEVAGMGDDGAQGPFDIPFPFTFYGEEKTEIWLGYNGSVGFNNGVGTLSHSNIPSPTAPNDAIQFWQRDMHCGYGLTTVFYEAVTIDDMDAFVIEYNHISQYGAAAELENTVSCEIILFANGNIICQYDYVGETMDRGSMSVGVDNVDGTIGLEYCFNNADNAPTEGLAILYSLGEENASVEGIVYDACTDQGIEGALVNFDGYNTVTDVDGFYSIPAMFSNNYTVTVMAEGFEDFVQPGVIVEEGENAFDIAMNPFPEIAVDPEAFTFQIPWNGQDSDVMTISNVSTCGADLAFHASINYLDEQGLAMRAVRDRVRENVARLRATPGTTITNAPATTDVNAFEYAPTGVRLNELDEPYYLLIQDRGAWGGAENQAIMTELEIPFDIIGGAQMTEWDLSEYSVVVFTSCQSQEFYNTFAANHDRFEDWVNAGGWMDFHGCIQNPQTWTFWDGMTMEYGTAPQNMVVEPDHPLVQGVDQTITGGSASHNYITELSEDALVIMENNTGMPVVAEINYGRGNVILNTQTWEFYYNQANQNNCGSVMINAFGYTINAEPINSWLVVEPSEGIVEADHSMDLDVVVNAEEADLLPGVYEAEIAIESNAVNGLNNTVFVTLIHGNPGFVSGDVLDSETGDPIEGAEVTAWLEGEYYRSVFSDQFGGYEMTLEQGTWDISANADEYYPSDIEQVEVIVAENTEQNFELDREIPGNFQIEFNGVDVVEEGLTFESAWMSSDTKTLTVENIGGLYMDVTWAIEYVDGFGWLSGNPAGLDSLGVEDIFEFTFTADARVNEMNPGAYDAIITFTSHDPYEVSATVFVTYIVNSPGIITGIVTDAATEEGIHGAEVIVWADDRPFRTVLTDEIGEYTMFVPEGTWDVSAHMDWYYDSEVVEVVTITGETIIQNFALDHEIAPTIDVTIGQEVGADQITFVAPQYGIDERDMIITNNGGMPLDFDINVEYIEDEELAQLLIDGINPFAPAEEVEELDQTREVVLPSEEDLSEASEEKQQHYATVINAYEDLQSGKSISGEARDLLANEGLINPLDNELDRVGGPDIAGYLFVDNEDGDGPEFEWLNISETGTVVNGMGDDGTQGPFDIPFPFPFYGQDKTQIWFGYNGSVGFNNGVGTLSHNELPHPNAPNDAIQFWQRDMHCGYGFTTVYYQTMIVDGQNCFVIEYNHLSQYGATHVIENTVSCEILLFEDGTIILQYDYVGATMSLNTFTVGIDNATGTDGLEYCYNNAEFAPTTGLAIAFAIGGYQGGGWLAAEPGDGIIEVTDDLLVELTADAERDSLEEGRYTALMEISTTYPDVMPTNVWATFIVGAGAIFNPVAPTGIPYPIIVEEALVNGEQMPEACGIAAFDGDLCVGAITTNGEWPRSMIVWQGDPERGIAGYTPGNDIDFKIWTEELNEVIDARAIYTEGDGTFGCMPYTQVTLIGDVLPTLDIRLQRNYFELVSTCIIPEDMNAGAIFGTIEELAIAYQDNGNIFIPPGLNTIGQLTITEAYRVFCFENSNLHIEGELMDEATPYDLSANRWNWMGYPFFYDVPVDVALAEIADQIQIIQTDDGRLWIPAVNVNTIGNMTPGEGYMVYVSNDVDFVFNNGQALAAGTTSELWETHEAEGAPQATGLPYTVLASFTDDVLALDPATVEVFDGSRLVGKAVVLEDRDYTPVITWEGNDEYSIDGFSAGNNMSFVLRNAEGSKLPVVASGKTPAFGEGAYANVTFEETSLPTEFTVEQGYPNPFNPSVTIPFALPSAGEVSFAVYNVLGQQVLQSSRTFEAGFHRFVFDANNSGAELVSGMYFLQVNYAGSVQTQKLMLLK